MIVNVRSTPDMVDLIADWGVDALFVQKFSKNNAYTDQNWSPEADQQSMKRLYDEAARRAEIRNITLVIADTVKYAPPARELSKNPVPEMSHLGCTRPFSDAIINRNGEVFPCCFGAPPMGFLKYQGFDEIWNGKDWQEFRRGLAEGDPPPCCRRCHLLRT
jgi:radical SAM protein with 4Fe4S-binding SPASM domain